MKDDDPIPPSIMVLLRLVKFVRGHDIIMLLVFSFSRERRGLFLLSQSGAASQQHNVTSFSNSVYGGSKRLMETDPNLFAWNSFCV